MTWWPRLLTVLLAYLAISAMAGGTLLVLDRTGGLLHLDLNLLRGTAFRDYLIPGMVLLTVGMGASLATFGAHLRRSWGPVAAIGMGVVLLMWITIQGSLIGFGDPLQLAHGLLALAILLLAVGWIARDPNCADPGDDQ